MEMKMESTNNTNTNIINCFSVDVEGFIESNLESFQVAPKYLDKAAEIYEIEKNMRLLLEILEEMKIKGTFFFVGRLVRDIPDLIKEVAKLGHEVACHSYEHLRLFNLKRDEFKKKLSAAQKSIEDLSGTRVYGFRAPDFSITASSIWALDALEELGFLYDSSIYPIGVHDVYGIKNAKPYIHKLPNGLIEFPLSTVKVLGRRLPFGGGGYFRLYPIFLTRLFIFQVNRLGHPGMFYIHPYEVGPVIPVISELSFYRKFRHYYNCKNGAKRLKRLLKKIKFGPAIQILKQRGLIELAN